MKTYIAIAMVPVAIEVKDDTVAEAAHQASLLFRRHYPNYRAPNGDPVDIYIHSVQEVQDGYHDDPEYPSAA